LEKFLQRKGRTETKKQKKTVQGKAQQMHPIQKKGENEPTESWVSRVTPVLHEKDRPQQRRYKKHMVTGETNETNIATFWTLRVAKINVHGPAEGQPKRKTPICTSKPNWGVDLKRKLARGRQIRHLSCVMTSVGQRGSPSGS